MRWHKKVAMLMLIGLLIAGPTVTLPYANAQGDRFDVIDRAINAAEAAQAKATQQLADMMKHMDSMMKMPMTPNEKAMTGMMEQMAATIKSLLDENKQLLDALKELRKMQNK
jgi:hypothetical protein